MSSRIWKPPIIIKGSADIRTADIAPHRNRYIWAWDGVNGLAVLCLLHINTVDLFHKPNSILVDLWCCFCSSGVKLKIVTS